MKKNMKKSIKSIKIFNRLMVSFMIIATQFFTDVK